MFIELINKVAEPISVISEGVKEGFARCNSEEEVANAMLNQSPDQSKSNGKLSAKQVGRLLAIGLKAGIKEPEIKKVIKAEFGKDKIEDLSIEDYNSVCSRLEAKVK